MPMVVMVLLVLIPHSTSDGATQALINQICRETDDFNFCRDVFNKHLYRDVTDIKGLTQIALTQTLIYATDTRIFIQKSEAKETNKNIKNLYKICETGYGIVMDEFEDASLAFAIGDYRSVVFDVEKCDRFVSDCQFVLGSKVAPLSVKNLHAKVLIRMALVSAGLIGAD
ncbi:hypothetical protein Pfo_011832 [Paulownia fortunei]|nr:hypothetical protein Pfo_011832 [Paulownia fortunei]